MNNILKYNSQLVLFILIASLIILIVILAYKIYERYFSKVLDITMGFKEREPFSQISLEKQVSLYDDYRNYINGRNELTSRCSLNKRMIPYIVSPKCFANKYTSCMEDKKVPQPSNRVNEPNEIQNIIDEAEIFDEIDQEKLNKITLPSNDASGNVNNVNHGSQYKNGFKIASRNCQEQSYDMCLTDNFNFI